MQYLLHTREYTGLAKKFVRVCLLRKPERTFWPTQYLTYLSGKIILTSTIMNTPPNLKADH